MGVGPIDQRHQHRIERLAPVGQPVFVAQGAVLISLAAQHAGPLQLAQPVRQHMPRDPQPVLHLLEPANAQKAIAQHQHGPAVAHHGQPPRHGAGFIL